MRQTCCLGITSLSLSTGLPATYPATSSTQPVVETPGTRLDISLWTTVQEYYEHGAAPSTRCTYATGERRYLAFCSEVHRSPLLTSESTLLLFVAYVLSYFRPLLSNHQGLLVCSALYACQQRKADRVWEAANTLQVVKGIKKVQAAQREPRIRHPITITIMQKIRSVLLTRPQSYSNIMLWAACCLAFFGFLRSSEFTVWQQRSYDKSVHLSLSDIALDSWASPKILRVHIKQSKMEPFRQGAIIYLGKSYKEICPVTAVVPYLAGQGN